MNKIIGPYIIKESVGSGQFGKVHLAHHRDSSNPVAIKIISIESLRKTPKLSEFLQNETKILSAISHKNIIKFFTMYHSTRNLYIVYEYCNGGNLDSHIKSKTRLDEDESTYIFAQILEGFRELFKNNILHRDLKPSNILLHETLVKIADFGFCKEIISANELSSTMVGSPIYMAPEILKGKQYSSKADIWSLGIVLFEMLYGTVPFYENNIVSLVNRLEKRNLVFPDSENVSANTKCLIRQLLIVDEEQRISWEVLLDETKIPEFNLETECSTIESREIESQFLAKTKRRHFLHVSTILSLVLENPIRNITVPVTLYLVHLINVLKDDFEKVFENAIIHFLPTERDEILAELEETNSMLSSLKSEIVSSFGSWKFCENVNLTSKMKLNISEYIEELLENYHREKRSKWLILAFAVLDCINPSANFSENIQEGKEIYFQNIKKIGKKQLENEILKKLENLFDSE